MIRRNTCSQDDCIYPVFAKKLCKSHQHLRGDKRDTKPKVNKTIKKPKYKASGERTLFDSIWTTRNRVSFISGKDLEQYNALGLYLNMFAHVLSKAQNKYPKFKLYDKNIVLLTPEEHYLLDFGTKDQREKYAKENDCSWQELYEFRDYLKELYNTRYI